MIWQSEQLEEALNQQVPRNLITGPIQFNSLDVKEGNLFIALKGEGPKDGHHYVKDAIDKGATAVIVSEDLREIDSAKVIKVADTYQALLKLAKYKRQKSRARFIGITGSTGKTSTKEITKIILESFGKTFASRGNFNNHLGVPINLASMPDDIDYAVIEMGMSYKGEIKELSGLVRPNIAVITNIGHAHIEFFNTIEDIADAKCEIFSSMGEDDVAILNADSPNFERILYNLRLNKLKTFKTFGSVNEADSRLQKYEVNSENNEIFLEYTVGKQQISLSRPLLPFHYAHNISASLLIAATLGKDIKQAKDRLKQIDVPSGRGNIIEIKRNNGQSLIMCDYYNATPAAVKAALSYLKLLNYKKKTIILGDMLELGKYSSQLHAELIPYILEAGPTKVVLVGNNMGMLASKLSDNLEVRTFENVDLVIKELDLIIGIDEFILIKGSKGMKLFKIVEIINEGF